jgi:carbon monoxide dehydrogenase subunit G
MFTFAHNLFISRPPQEVFDFVTDPANDVHWRDSVVLVEWTSAEPHGIGSTQGQVDKFLGREIASTIEITVWDPPHQLGQKTTGGPIQFAFTMQFKAVDGGTHMDMNGQAEFGGIFKMAEGLVRQQLVNLIKSEFNNLKRVLEDGRE